MSLIAPINIEQLTRFRQIGVDITALTKESKELRSQIVENLAANKLVVPNEKDQPLKLLVDNTLITVSRDASGSKDYSITFLDLPQLKGSDTDK